MAVHLQSAVFKCHTPNPFQFCIQLPYLWKTVCQILRAALLVFFYSDDAEIHNFSRVNKLEIGDVTKTGNVWYAALSMAN